MPENDNAPESLDLFDAQELAPGDPSLVAPSEREPFRTMYVHFECMDDLRAFEQLVGHAIPLSSSAIWFPRDAILSQIDRRYVRDEKPND